MISRTWRPLLALVWVVVAAAQTTPTFQTQFLNLFPNEFVTAAAIGDVDGDGRPEVVAVNNNINLVRIARVRTDGTVQILAEVQLPSQRAFPPWAYVSMKIVDMNGDGKKDITCWQRGNNLKGRLYLLEQSSNLSFAVSTFDTPETDAAYSMDVADINGDGLPDLITANFGFAASARLFVSYNGNGPTRFASFDVVSAGTAAIVHVYATDLNRDGRPDALVTTHSFGTPGVRIIYNTGTRLGQDTGLPSPRLSFTLGVGDLNNDGQPDIVATDGTFSNAIRLYRASGTGYSGPQTINTPLEPRSPRFGDFNRDGLTDMMLDNSYDRTMSIYLGSPSTNDLNLVPIVLQTPELSQIDHGAGGASDALLIGDVDGDGDDDGLYTGSRLVWIRNGTPAPPQARTFLVLFSGFAQTPSECELDNLLRPTSEVCLQYPFTGTSLPSLQDSPGMNTALANLVLLGVTPAVVHRAAAFTFYGDLSGGPYFTPSGNDKRHKRAMDWLSAQGFTSGDRLIIAGFSLGGNRARLFAEEFLDAGHLPAQIVKLILVDPIDWSRCGFESAVQTALPILRTFAPAGAIGKAGALAVVLGAMADKCWQDDVKIDISRLSPSQVSVVRQRSEFKLRGYTVTAGGSPVGSANVFATHSDMDDLDLVQRAIILAAAPSLDLAPTTFDVTVSNLAAVRSANGYDVLLTITNRGPLVLSNLTVTSATLFLNSAILPSRLEDLRPGSSTTVRLTFSSLVGLLGSSGVLRVEIDSSVFRTHRSFRIAIP